MLNVENFPEVLCACITFQSDWRAPLKVNLQFKVYKVKVDECYEHRYILLVLAIHFQWSYSEPAVASKNDARATPGKSPISTA